MSHLPHSLLLLLVLLLTAGYSMADDQNGPFHIGQIASQADISKWNIDVKPNGEGLPMGEGSVAAGKRLYDAKCESCHGIDGKNGAFGSLVSDNPSNEFEFSRNPDAVKTIGNYWPYATTVFDYIQRAMPFEQPGSLSANEVYSLVAYLLSENNIISADTVLNNENLPNVIMPARDKFVPDNRKGGGEVL